MINAMVKERLTSPSSCFLSSCRSLHAALLTIVIVIVLVLPPNNCLFIGTNYKLRTTNKRKGKSKISHLELTKISLNRKVVQAIFLNQPDKIFVVHHRVKVGIKRWQLEIDGSCQYCNFFCVCVCCPYTWYMHLAPV